MNEDLYLHSSAQSIANEGVLTGAISKADDFLVSTITDFATTAFNSIIDLPSFFMPKSLESDTSDYKLDTFDVLNKVNSNYAEYFEENRDLVQTASFLGGALLPGGAALKGMKYIRSGKFAMYPEALSAGRAKEDVKRLSQMLEEGKQATADFQNMRRGIYTRMAANEGIDSLAMEAAIIGTMSAHPMMEDYMKDPWSNFFLWAGIGGVLGTGLGAIAKNHEIRTTLGKVYEQAISTLTDPAMQKSIVQGLPTAETAGRYIYNADMLETIAADAGKNQLTRDMATFVARSMKGRGQKLLLDSISPDIKAIPGMSKEEQAGLIEHVQGVLRKDTSFGVDSVAFTKPELKVDLRKPSYVEIKDMQKESTLDYLGRLARGTAASTDLPKFAPDFKKLAEDKDFTGWSPVFGAYVPKDQLWAVQTAVDLGKKEARSIDVTVPYLEADDLFSRVSNGILPAHVNERFIDALHSVFTVKNLNIPKQIVVHELDLPVLSAWVSRLDSLKGIETSVEFKVVPTGTQGRSLTSGTLEKAQTLSMDQLSPFLSKQKEKVIHSLARVGASMQEIATRADVDVKAVEAFLYERVPLDKLQGWRKTSDSGSIKDYLSQTNRVLQLNVNPFKRDALKYRNTSQAATNLDSKAMDVFNRQIVEEEVLKHQSEAAQTIFRELNNKKEFFDILRTNVGEVNNELVGTHAFTSVDQALRRLGNTGPIIAQASKDIYNLVNRISEQQLRPLSNQTRQIVGNGVFLSEFNTIANTLAGTAGYRFMTEDGSFFVRENMKRADGVSIPGQYVEKPIFDSYGQPLQATHAPNIAWFNEMRRVGGELREFSNTLRGIQGSNPLQDIGLWIPSFNPINKFISYVIDPDGPIGQQVKILSADTAQKLAGLEKEWKEMVGGGNPQLQLITKSEQESYNLIQNRLDPIEMDYSDIALRHSGASGQALTPTGTALIGTTIENLHSRFLNYTRKLTSSYLSDTMHVLDNMSEVNRKYTEDQPLRGVKKFISSSKDSAREVKNTLLGENNLNQYGTWQLWNNGTKGLIEIASSSVSKAFEKNFDFDNLGAMKNKDYKKFSKDLENAGVRNPFKTYDEYTAFKGKNPDGVFIAPQDTLYAQYLKGQRENKATSADAIVAAANGVMATLALRVMDLAHPLVNALSLPIMSSATLMSAMPKTFLGTEVGPQGTGGVVFAARAMYDGVRARFNPALSHVLKEFEREGFIAPIVSEASEVMRLVHSGEKNAAAQVNKILDSGLVKKLSIAADTVETETRAVSLMTGYLAAKRAYPGITHEGAKIYAKQFMDRAIGNYYSYQRPAMFQGTLGVAIGLFQTYMLSMAQSIYRNVEEKQFKALAGSMLTQAGMFGTASLPFYDLISKTVGSNTSDKHYDLTTGTYRALPDPMAEFILYGMPSNIGTMLQGVGIDALAKEKGIALYNRGELNPRLPFVAANPLEQIVAVNALMQLVGATAHTAEKIAGAQGAQQVGQALLEGISMQSISRPIARGAEVIGGYSVSREGNTIATPDNIWSATGIAARVLSSRTTEEQIKRQADHLNSFYGALDFDNRQRAVEGIKQALRSGNLNDEILGKVAERYMRTGSPAGWKAALNEAIAGTDGGIDYRLGKKLRPDSPLNLMMGDL